MKRQEKSVKEQEENSSGLSIKKAQVIRVKSKNYVQKLESSLISVSK